MFNAINFSHRTAGREGRAVEPDTDFENPDLYYAPHTFWFWDGSKELKSPEHFADMAEGMSEKRLNPGYIHARYYRKGESFWLSDDWYKCFQAALEASEKSGTYMSYTMGDPCFPDKYLLAEHPEFPDWIVGGKKLTDHPELRAVSLEFSVLEAACGECCDIGECFFAVAVMADTDGHLLSSKRCLITDSTWRVPENGHWRLYVFKKTTDYKAQYIVNFLDRRLTAPWLELENSKYEELFENHFGKTMKCVFLDLEGCFGYKIAWSEDLRGYYSKRYGRDIRLDLPLLLAEDVEGLWPKIRRDWFYAVGEVYAECVFRPLDRWCQARKMVSTCHFWEEQLFLQANRVADFMNAQRGFSMPGTDALFRTIHDPRYFKETQSVCEFEGRQYMCEVFGIIGWHVTPNEMKAGANSAVAMGLTHIIPHGICSRRELEKVSYPPDFYNWNPYWRYFHLWTDFTRRACFVNDHGRLDADVLLFCPLDSVTALIGDAYFDPRHCPKHEVELSDVQMRRSSEIAAIEDAYTKAMRDLYNSRVDFMVVDSHYLELLEVDAGVLKKEAFSFQTLVLPPLKILSVALADKIVEFAKSGGYVYVLGELPDSSTEKGEGDPELLELMKELKRQERYKKAEKGLEDFIVRRNAGLEPCVTFESGEFPLVATKRIVNEKSFYWLANNTDQIQKFTLEIKESARRVAIWDCENGGIRSVPYEKRDTASVISLTMEPWQAFWLVLGEEEEAFGATLDFTGFKVVATLDGMWNVSVDSDDQPNLAQHELAAPEWLSNGHAERPLESWLKWDLNEFSGFVDYEKEFEMDHVSGDEIVDLGKVKHMAEVWVNGQHAGIKLWGEFRFKIGPFLKTGNNTLKVKVGNLLLNAVTQYKNYRWKWFDKPTDEQLDCGLYGPVTIIKF